MSQNEIEPYSVVDDNRPSRYLSDISYAESTRKDHTTDTLSGYLSESVSSFEEKLNTEDALSTKDVRSNAVVNGMNASKNISDLSFASRMLSSDLSESLNTLEEVPSTNGLYGDLAKQRLERIGEDEHKRNSFIRRSIDEKCLGSEKKIEQQPAEEKFQQNPRKPGLEDLETLKDESTIGKIGLIRTSRAELISNIILVLGYICNVLFNHYQLTGNDREPVAIHLYFWGFGLLLLSATIEVMIDLYATRVLRHGRYCSSSFWNIVISLLFIIAGSVDIVAFVFWEQRRLEVEKNLLLLSAYTLLLMIIIVIYFQIYEKMRGLKNWVDVSANYIAFVAVILNLIIRHFQKADILKTEAKNIEFAASLIWLESGVMYFVTVVIGYKNPNLEDTDIEDPDVEDPNLRG